MKKKCLYGVAAIFTISLFLGSCSNETEQEKQPSEQTEESQVGEEVEALPMPEGTTFKEVKSSKGDVERIDFKLPKDFAFYGVTTDGKMISDNGGSIKCSCSNSGSCKPFAAGGKMGCITENCSTCTGTTSAKKEKSSLSLYFIQNGAQPSMSELSAMSDARPMYVAEEWLKLPFPTKAEVDSKEFQEALNGLLNPSKSSSKNDKNLVAVAIVVKGKKMLMNMSFDEIESGVLYTNAISSKKYKCTGSCSGGTCKLETAGMGQVSYCDGCNSGCSLHMPR
jgi:hypothetical protein